jgi:anti-sigma regulatory factor (Ser/Thr protein kinase)
MRQADCTIPADLANLGTIAEFIARTLRECDIDEEVLFAVQLAVDEACSNIILYGYPEGEAGTITITCTVDEESVRVMIADDGRPFDPLTVHPPRLDVSLEERQIGGLGVHFIRTVMDGVVYSYENGRNVLKLTKQRSARRQTDSS